MSGKIEISRELAELLANGDLLGTRISDARQELRALLIAAPVVERQPVAEVDRLYQGYLKWTTWGQLESPRLPDGTKLYTEQPAPVAVGLPEPVPITKGMERLMEAYRLGEFKLESGSPTVEAMSCASYDNSETAMRDHDFDSYAAGYQAAMYEEAKSLLGHIACLDKVKELNQ